MSVYLTHLRLPFQLLLSPIFLWGFLMGGGLPSLRLAVAFGSFHLFGYAGGTAFNSRYDRDSGPIGGLAHPPPVPPHLLGFSLLWQAIGFLLALTVNSVFAVIYGAMFLLSVAYSHPITRWKGKPQAALFTVAAGQGVLASLGGWAVARGELGSALSLEGLLTVASVTLITTGFYPLTQIYQVEEDKRRGDTTVALWLGARGSFGFALTLIAAGGAAALWQIARQFGSGEAAGLGLALLAVLAAVGAWGRRYDAAAVMRNFKIIMGIYGAVSVAFMVWIIWRLFVSGI